ncbi:M12 family metallo-peptidase [Rhizobium phaseoli]|uniref:M12 family metallo-peptidase n=1 Tax=Rhizobium phaseoli TaxID=396 RepID=UPI0007EB5A2D|nr:M12 family metallo-peptidase [Rhizobium phaseoli]ANL41439.1 hypothetical protein AMC88_CH03074 [Rhizobium phaseoli]ANL60427.1 hypothetical protein AMC85_CH03073 [Rhizobium phaseoli]
MMPLYRVGYGVAAVSLILLASMSEAQDLKRVSVFSPVNAANFIERLKPLARTNQLQFSLDALPGGTVSPTDAGSIVSVMKPDDNRIARRNIVVLNNSDLSSALSSMQNAAADVLPVLSLDLFPDTPDGRKVNVELIPRRVKTTEEGNTIVLGEVKDQPGSRVVLTMKGPIITGTIQAGGSSYNIYPFKGLAAADAPSQGLTAVDEIIEPFPNEAEPQPSAPADVPLRNDQDLDINGGLDPSKIPAHEIRMAILYTRDAMEAQGGQEAMALFVDGLIEELNDIFQSSAIQHNVKKAYSGTIDLTETGDVLQTRDALQASGDGKLDDVQKIRDQNKIDVVSLIVERGLPICGISFIPEDIKKDYREYGYFVVVRQCAEGNLSFAHEFAHVLGARHDRYRDNLEGMPIDRNHGITYTCGVNLYCRDIMAYSNYCVDKLNVPRGKIEEQCPRERIFGGPEWPNSKIIVPTEDKDMSTRTAIQMFGAIVAAYR